MKVKPVATRAGRREQAARTRIRILDAAYRLLCAEGYEATTMQMVAEAAGVAVQTVYFVFGTKARLLTEVENRVVLGDAPLEQWRERPWVTQIQHETDPRKLLALFVDVDTDIKSRISPFTVALGSALPSDPQSVAARNRGRDEFFGIVIDRLVALGALRDEVTPSHAMDVIRVINTVDAYADLTTRRGWTVAEWKAWLTDLLCVQLLAHP
ncbi:MAG TPA: helix-turn-helix domain-containing protein [Candidatus Nitrosopolaris sp.]|nr:helix-turn-helix domain-containing protein [Candidatus Nitrosopolaris sp.]